MKSESNLKKKIDKKIKSLEVNNAKKIKNVLRKKSGLNKSVIYNSNAIYEEIMDGLGRHNDQEEISLLSNANINILKMLNSAANDDILNDSSFMLNNNEHRDNSLETHRNKNPNGILKNKSFRGYKKRRFGNKSSKTNFVMNPHLTELGSDNREKKLDSINLINKFRSNKTLTSAEKKSEDKPFFVTKKKIRGFRHSSNRITDFNARNDKKIFNPRERSKSIKIDNIIDLKNIRYGKSKKDFSSINNNISSQINYDVGNNNNNNYKSLLSEVEIMKINEHIHNDINFIQLKKKISHLKKSIQNKSTKNDLLKFRVFKNLGNKPSSNKKINTIIEHHKSREEEETIIKDSKNKLINVEKKNSNSGSHPDEKTTIDEHKEKYRVFLKKNMLYDSFDDEEYNDEDVDFYISPNTWFIRIFDSLLFLSSVIYLIFVPFFLSQNSFNINDYKLRKIGYILIDIIYVLDVIINFCRAYQNFDENLVKQARKIFFHYLKSWFFLDFIQAIPYYSIIKFLETQASDNQYNVSFVGYYIINPKIYLLLLIKIIKVYKLFNGSTMAYFSEKISKNEFIDEHGGFLVSFFLIVFALNMTTCLFIFIGLNSYPGWIIELNLQDSSFLNIYLTSLYFVIVTITTVGYGDITGKTIPELVFQMVLLIIGTIAYSFTISYISNYIIKSNKKSMSFEKNFGILQEIRLHHPNMSDYLYNEVLRNINNEQLYERKDKHLLLDCLPYSLKNKLIMEMFNPLIKNFVFFKDIDNSDFIVKVSTSLKPLITVKGDIVIQEGDFIKEIIFLKKGVITLNICLDLDDLEFSIKKYFYQIKSGNSI